MFAESTLARPYARAAFDTARDAGAVEEWRQALGLAAEIAATPELRALTGDPRVSGEQLLELFTDVGGDVFFESFCNFLKVLLANDRLPLLVEIAAQFEQLRRAAEQRVPVRVSTAIELDDQQRQRLAERLSRRLGAEVEMQTEVDESLLGGLIVRAGDQVIDASIRGRLERLGRQLTR